MTTAPDATPQVPPVAPPVGPEVDPTPRPLPARVPHRGTTVTLEPLGLRHAEELWEATRGAEDSWAYLGYGPFPDLPAFRRFIAGFATTHDPMAWAVRPHVSGRASGWLTLMEIQPANAAIELGNIWFGPRMQRTRAATEAMFLLMRHAMDDLGYRRLVWKCNALNAPSQRAAARLGFVPEGLHRAHLVVKGRRRDTAWFSILEDEWPARRDAIAAWLADGNFDHKGVARQPLRAGEGAPRPKG
ncbi:N-acetyltransferase [Roseomonas sp. M0104]|uniref:N-acetyltransferase n=1 Tax=Teichococcus coralli TaxID=2545983 RepID=A0A845BEZ3_9PROT|nr:GNAT family protein [Pseudoroseomonas coralli]MXP64686.1 N-acetyltransferase [Pseudoroseomonas coralli]